MEAASQDYLLERYRFDVGIQPLPWMAFFGEFQDARVHDRADVRQAYVRIGREDGWSDVKAGRQKLAFRSERVVGASEWGNTARAFDAVKLSLHHKNDHFDIFSSSVVINNTN